MYRAAYCIVILLTIISSSQPCHAARVKAYVNRFAVSAGDRKEELKASLQTLLMSRLNSDAIQAVETPADAEIQIVASYFAFGTVFSIDALLKSSKGDFIDRVFVQGEVDNELIPAVAEMANQLRLAIFKWQPGLAAGVPAGAGVVPAIAREKVLRPLSKPAVAPSVAVQKAARPETKTTSTPGMKKPADNGRLSYRLPETLNGIATGRTLGERGVEIFVTGERYLRYYLGAKTMQFLTAAAFAADEKIIGVDVADLDQNEVPEIYVTVLKGGLPASRVFIPENNLLKKVADDIPYLLRGVAIPGQGKKILAQKISAGGIFSGAVYELVKSGDSFTTAQPLSLPALANLYNFTRFTNAKGEHCFIVSHPDGYLLVYSQDKKQLWKSRDKFGGSETTLCQPAESAPDCSSYLPQRLLVTKTGDILVTRNSGLSRNGASRHYTKNSVVRLSWTGTALKESWRSEQSGNYLADYAYDDQGKELLLLEVEPAAELQEERGSRVVVKVIE